MHHPGLDPDVLVGVLAHDEGELLDDVLNVLAAEQLIVPTDSGQVRDGGVGEKRGCVIETRE